MDNGVGLTDALMPSPPDTEPEARPSLPRPRLERRTWLHEIADTVWLVITIFALVNLITARFIVEGASMEPNFETDQFIIVSRLAYLFGEPRRGDVIVFHAPDDPDHDFIKRVIGLPGETVAVQAGQVYINGVPLEEPYIRNPPLYDGEWTVGPTEYFVLGDNRNNSRDSHSFGPLARESIIGQAWIIYWPPKDWGVVPHYAYDGLGASLPTATMPTAGSPLLIPSVTAFLPPFLP